MLAKPFYDAIDEIKGDHAVVVKNGKYGLINSRGAQIVQCKYTFIRQMSDDLLLINQGGDCSQGECEGGKWGVQNIKTKAQLSPQFDLITAFNSSGFAMVNAGGKCDYRDCKGGLWGVADTMAQQPLACEYLEIKPGLGTEVYIRGEKGWGIFDLASRKMVMAPVHKKLERLNDETIAVQGEKAWALYSTKGEKLTEEEFESLQDAGQNYVAYSFGTLFGLMDSKGERKTMARFEQIQVNPNSWITFRKDNHWGLLSLKDEVLLTPMLTEITHFDKNVMVAKRGNSVGVVNRSGKVIIPFRYEKVTISNDTLCFFRDRKFYKWVNSDGEIVQNLNLEALEPFSTNNVAKAKYAGKWGLLNWEGQWIIPPSGDEIIVFRQAAKIKVKGKWKYFYFDKNGRPSKVKRIILVSDGEMEEEDPNVGGFLNGPNGWFMNSQRKWGLRSPTSNQVIIMPKYTDIALVRNTNVTAVKGKVGKSEDLAWGLVDQTTGKALADPLFEKIYIRDFDSGAVARAVYRGSGKFALLSLSGEVVNIKDAGFIGEFQGDVARINVGGRLGWYDVADIDTIESISARDRFTNEVKMSYKYCRGGKWGFIDKEGNWLKEAKYETALDFGMGVSRVRMDGKWGAINKDYKTIVEPKYDFIEPLFILNGRTYLAIGKNKVQMGFIDPKGEISIKPQFEKAGSFHNGLVKIFADGKWGYANTIGEIVIQPQYKEVGDFHEGIARVRDKRWWGFIDSLGNPITKQKYLRAGDFNEGLAWVQDEKFFGFVDRTGAMVVKPAYSAVADFSEGLAPAKRKGRYGMINKSGNWVLSPKYYRIGGFHDSLAVVQEKGTFGLINPKGEFVVRPSFNEIADFSEGLAKFKNGLLYGYLDRNGNSQIESQFPNAGDFSCGRAPIFVKGSWGYIDTTGQVAIPVEFPKVMPFSENRAAIRKGKDWGFIDPSGEIVVPLSFGKVGAFKDERAAVFIEGQGWGFINPEGTLVIPCEYDEVGWGMNGIYCVRKDKKWGLINRFGAVMTPCKYDGIGTFHEDLAKVSRLRSIGVVDSRGKEILAPQYDNVHHYGNLLQVESDEAIGYIDINGNWIWELSK